jgi:trehalose synthase
VKDDAAPTLSTATETTDPPVDTAGASNGGLEHEASTITYDEQFYPARPRRLRPSARRAARASAGSAATGKAEVGNPDYVRWLANESMLSDADHLARQLSGQGSMWQNPFADPDPRSAVERAPVWFTAYPLSFVTRPGQSFLAGLADPELWRAFTEIGISAVHTGPVKGAGGIEGWNVTPSVDGHFDRISMQVDPAFGTEDEFRALCTTASEHDAVIIDDIVPGHTGKGADFRLAEMAFAEYPGIYHMVSIPPEHWHLLPDVGPRQDAANLTAEAEAALAEAGYIIGQLQRVIFYEPGVKETNWSATREVEGVDGVVRRWVYLHYFKAGQPSINWLDPTFAGMRLVIGDALHALADMGAGALRLDANGFLGVEKRAAGSPAWSEGHPLSEAANQLIAGMIRKMGGFSFQELNLGIDDIRAMSEAGADLSYDFVNRPAYHHALVTGDTEFLRLTLNLALTEGVDPASLVHALQNHDELTHELVHFSTGHADDLFPYDGGELRGEDLAARVRGELCARLTGPDTPYNLRFTTNGIACTTASVIAATLGLPDLDALSDDDIAQIRDIHLLLAMFNALQPGVFALSGWDLSGTLTLPVGEVADLVRDGDTRWINRGAHDLLGATTGTVSLPGVMPRGRSLYGTLPEQLASDDSFARRLGRVIAVREKYGIATSTQLDVPSVSHHAMLVMVHGLEDGSQQITVLNFGAEALSGTVRSEALTPGGRVVDMFSDDEVGHVDDLNSFSIDLPAYEGRALHVRPSVPEGDDAERLALASA